MNAVAIHRDLIRDAEWPVEFGAAYDALMNQRDRADYWTDIEMPLDLAEAAVENARRALLQVLRSHPEFGEIDIPPS